MKLWKCFLLLAVAAKRNYRTKIVLALSVSLHHAVPHQPVLEFGLQISGPGWITMAHLEFIRALGNFQRAPRGCRRKNNTDGMF